MAVASFHPLLSRYFKGPVVNLLAIDNNEMYFLVVFLMLGLLECWCRFSDAFSFLISLSKEIHIWCGNWDLMGPLLETFYNYFKDSSPDSPLKTLWARISQELRQCTQCISQHHQAQESYVAEYESDTVGPLLSVLRSMDEERVTKHLKEINARINGKECDSESHDIEIVSVMFEVRDFLL